ncbi:disintegrin and metalloproteinase domain-containing protein 10-like [Photinus pyralis]|uniref:disintegrin and metalloproteinase domain-containing protein 10-like n=1 Tax=Photinus pyralis TaxID=7054 RepID=UPI00126721B3|nr:disintegrin and metalloproteinase domain-containing protein 10-like [Photinus pyralis]
MFRTCVVLVIVFVIHLSASPLDPLHYTKGFQLNSFIHHYEPARYDRSRLDTQHSRVRRSVTHKHDVRLEIRGHGRTFRLRLTPDREVFAEDVSFESTKGPLSFDSKMVYTGTLEDDENASVHGIVTKDGLFDGMVSTASEEYYIEPINRYLPHNQSHKSPSFHSIMYKTSDVKNPNLEMPCASHILYVNNNQNKLDKLSRRKRWLLEGNSKDPYDEFSFWHPSKSKNPISTSIDIHSPFNQPIDEEMTTSNRTSFDFNFRHVNKRATIDPKKTTCMLYLQADHQFFQKYGTEEACIEVMTRHVQRVNAIYRTTDFNQDGKLDNITFMIKRIKVHTTEALKDPLYRYPSNYGVEKFLELFSGKCFFSIYIYCVFSRQSRFVKFRRTKNHYYSGLIERVCNPSPLLFMEVLSNNENRSADQQFIDVGQEDLIRCPLSDIPYVITFHQHPYRLRGVINYKTPIISNDNGHYILLYHPMV